MIELQHKRWGAIPTFTILGVYPANHALKQLSGQNEVDIAKTYWNTMDQRSHALCCLSASQGSNCFASIYKETDDTGRIEIRFVSTGVTQVWKRGYGDSDFIQVTT